MSNPTEYKRGYSFAGYQANSPTDPLPGPKVDVELDNLSNSVGELIYALGNVRRSDGKINNKKVTFDSLDDDLRIRLMEIGNPVTVESFDSVAQAAAADIPVGKGSIFIGGYDEAGDGGAAVWRSVLSEPVHAGKFQDAGGKWWELGNQTLNPIMFGAVGDGFMDDVDAMNDFLNCPVSSDLCIPAGKTFYASHIIAIGRSFSATATSGSPVLTGITVNSPGIPSGSVISLRDPNTGLLLKFGDGSFTATTTTAFVSAGPTWTITINKNAPATVAGVVGFIVADQDRGPVTLRGPGRIKLATNRRFRVNTPGTVVDGVTFDANGAQYCTAVEILGARSTIRSCRYSGDAGNYVAVFAPQVLVTGNVCEGSTTTTQITPIAASSYRAVGVVISDNIIRNHRGFGIQTKFAQNVVIRGNTIDNDTYYAAETYEGDGVENTFDFNMVDGYGNPVQVIRRAPWVGDVPKTSGVTITDISGDAGTTWRTVFAAPPAPGQTIRFVGWRALEPININSDSFNISVLGNTIRGSGDTGIVIADDETTPVPPERVVVSGNTIEQTMGASIAMTHTATQVIISGNTCKDWGWGQDFATNRTFIAAIDATGDGFVVEGNTCISNLDSPVGSPKSTGIGITWNSYPGSTADLLLDNDPGDGDALAKFGNNVFKGSFTYGRYYIPNANALRRKFGLVITDAPTVPWTTVDTDTPFVTKPADTPQLLYSVTSGTAWSYATGTILGGVGAIFVQGDVASESFVNIVPVTSVLPRLMNKTLIVDFDAIAPAGNAYFSIFSDVALGTDRVRVNVTTNQWRHFTMRFPITLAEQLSTLFFRIGANTGTGNSGYFQNIVFSLQTIPT